MILDESLDKYYIEDIKKPRCRALTTGTAGHNKSAIHWVYGLPCILPDPNGKYPGKTNAIRTSNGSVYPIQPSTLSQWTYCVDCKNNPIYEGDIVLKNKQHVRWVQYNEKYAAYITVRRGGAGDYSADYLAKGEDMCRHLEVVGNIWQNPELIKRKHVAINSLEEMLDEE